MAPSHPSELPGYGAQPKYETIVRLEPMRYGLTVRRHDGQIVVHELGRTLPAPPLPRFRGLRRCD